MWGNAKRQKADSSARASPWDPSPSPRRDASESGDGEPPPKRRHPFMQASPVTTPPPQPRVPSKSGKSVPSKSGKSTRPVMPSRFNRKLTEKEHLLQAPIRGVLKSKDVERTSISCHAQWPTNVRSKRKKNFGQLT